MIKWIKSIKNSLAIKHRVYNELISHKKHISYVWSMNLAYIHERNNYNETESIFSKDYIYCISDQTNFIKKSLIEFQWRWKKIKIIFLLILTWFFKGLFFINNEIFLKY
jgi:hypothetical protein